MSNIELVIKSNPTDIGDNFLVRRALPKKEKRMIGPFIFWDHMGPVELEGERHMKVRAHPHIGLATITWLFTGEIMHRDSIGNEQAIRPGEVNWMTAGSGIAHSERAHPPQGEKITIEGIQLWLALPKEHENMAPNFFHCKSSELMQKTENGVTLTLIAGKACGMTSVVPVYSDLFYLNGEAKLGSEFQMALENNHEGAIYVVDGELEIEEKIYDNFSLVSFKKGTEISFKALKDSKVMILGGEVFPEERHIWWNFVSTSQEKIELAKQRWKNNEFAPVINEKEYIPLPE